MEACSSAHHWAGLQPGSVEEVSAVRVKFGCNAR
jgi:hypothetical protein